MSEKNAWGWALPWSWEHEDSSLPVSIFKHLWRGHHFPWTNCGVTDPGEGAAQGFGEPCVHQAAYALLVVPEELQLEGHIKQKIVSHLLLAWHCMSSVLSSWGFSMDTAFCCSRCWPSWLLREVAASAQSLQVHWGVFMARQPGSEETWEQGQMLSFPEENWSVTPKGKDSVPIWKQQTLHFYCTPFLMCVCVKCEIPTIFFYWKFDLLK